MDRVAHLKFQVADGERRAEVATTRTRRKAKAKEASLPALVIAEAGAPAAPRKARRAGPPASEAAPVAGLTALTAPPAASNNMVRHHLRLNIQRLWCVLSGRHRRGRHHRRQRCLADPVGGIIRPVARNVDHQFGPYGGGRARLPPLSVGRGWQPGGASSTRRTRAGGATRHVHHGSRHAFPATRRRAAGPPHRFAVVALPAPTAATIIVASARSSIGLRAQEGVPRFHEQTAIRRRAPSMLTGGPFRPKERHLASN